MTVREFSDQFDTQVNSFGLGPQVNFDEYEKSVFLTKAQEQFVVTLYNGRNAVGDSFESSEEVRRYLEPLVVSAVASPIEDSSNLITLEGDNSYCYKLADNVLFIIYEGVDWSSEDVGCLPHNNIEVKPMTHDEYHRVKKNPFRGVNNHRVLRLDINLENTTSQYVELISKYPIDKYKYRYIRRPKPIILENLTEGLSLGNGETTIQTSELNETLHDRILELAVQLALQSRSINNNNS